MLTRSSAADTKTLEPRTTNSNAANRAGFGEKCAADDFQAQAVGQLDFAEQELQEIKRVLKSLTENSN